MHVADPPGFLRRLRRRRGGSGHAGGFFCGFLFGGFARCFLAGGFLFFGDLAGGLGGFFGGSLGRCLGGCLGLARCFGFRGLAGFFLLFLLLKSNSKVMQ